jgi:hypothetical protein
MDGSVRYEKNDIPNDPSGRVRSTTSPIVFANLTGLWGVLAVGIGVRSRVCAETSRNTWKEEHFTLADGDVSEHAIIHDPQCHRPVVLVEPFLLS